MVRINCFLSDISEFSIPAGKVYLSPTMDCFDGLLVAWRISRRPNAELVNGMLDDVIDSIGESCKPIIHTDYAEEKTMPKFFVGYIA